VSGCEWLHACSFNFLQGVCVLWCPRLRVRRSTSLKARSTTHPVVLTHAVLLAPARSTTWRHPSTLTWQALLRRTPSRLWACGRRRALLRSCRCTPHTCMSSRHQAEPPFCSGVPWQRSFWKPVGMDSHWVPLHRGGSAQPLGPFALRQAANYQRMSMANQSWTHLAEAELCWVRARAPLHMCQPRVARGNPATRKLGGNSSGCSALLCIGVCARRCTPRASSSCTAASAPQARR